MYFVCNEQRRKNNVQIAAVSSRDQSLAATGITSGDSR